MAPVKGLVQRLTDGESVICAEGYLWELERRGFVTCGDFTPEVVLDYPERVQSLSEEFVWAGSDVVEAYTYYGHREKLKSVGRADGVEALNRTALRMARHVADKNHVLMAGNISNTTCFNPDIPATIQQARDMFKEQITWAVQEGADYIICETFSRLEEARLALRCVKDYGNGLPCVVTMAAYAYDVTYEGVHLARALRQLEEEGAVVVGLNCGRGPDTMLPLLRQIRAECKGPIAALPNPVRTSDRQKSMYNVLDPRDGSMAFPYNVSCVQSSRSDIQKFAKEARDLGVTYIGLCCGANPALTREVAQVYGRTPVLAKFAPDASRSFYFQTDEESLKMKAFMFGEKESWP